MPGIEGSPWVVSESGVFEGVFGGFKEPGCRAKCSAKGKPSPTPIGGD